MSQNLRDIERRSGRVRKPNGVKGAMIYTFLGDNPPANESDWTRWGTVSKATCEITMAKSAPFGTVLWIAAANHARRVYEHVFTHNILSILFIMSKFRTCQYASFWA